MIESRVGAYRLTARIGGGGMGDVYRAVRVEDFTQQVAVKLIRRGIDSDVIVRRFHTEIHVQAALGKHPNLLGVLDAGTTEDGRPYFVMEYVDGRRIDEYCDTLEMDVPARLRTFAQVCEAVHFAHRHAVIHRDLKPSNILVTADGVPKLIDFGIAKLVHPEPGDGPGLAGFDPSATLTRTGELVLTPEYASPEQVQGEPVTTASDVYALGVVLYQLLTGRRPYRLKAGTTPEIFRAICEQVPERPGAAVAHRPGRRADRSARPAPASPPTPTTARTAPSPEPVPMAAPSPGPGPSSSPTPEAIAAARGTTPGRLKRILGGDLETIVLMALRKEPERRYASAEQFADDIRRYLDGLPVRAHRDSPAYRAAKFVRRHTAAVAAGVALILALVAGIVGTTTGLILARRERDRAERSFGQAREAVNQFFTRVSEERLLNQPGLHPLRKALLQDAQRFYEDFLDRRGGNPALRAELAAARARVARITGEIGSPAEAAAQFQQAVALWEALVATQPGNPAYREELARALTEQGAVLIRLEGRDDEALRTFRRAGDLIEPLIAAEPRSIPRRRALGSILQNVATVELRQGRPRQAIATLRRELEIVEQLATEDPRALEPRIALAQAHALMGQVLLMQPEGTGPALASYQQAVDLLEPIASEHPGLAEQTYLLATYLGDLNVVQQQAGKLDSALRSTRRAVAILERLDQRYPGVLDYQGVLASTYNMMSDLHRRRREPAEALACAEKARTRLERLVAEHPEYIYPRVDLAKACNNIGRGLQQDRDPAEALKSFQRAVDLYESLPHLDPRNSYNLACNLALCIPLIGAQNGTEGTLDAGGLSPADRSRRKHYGDRAVEVLRRATRGGFVNLEILRADTDLDPLRGRPDFQQLIREVETKSAADRK
jgi:non-specific serine/threonine protein kinase/serine/threonine-protein kinase